MFGVAALGWSYGFLGSRNPHWEVKAAVEFAARQVACQAIMDEEGTGGLAPSHHSGPREDYYAERQETMNVAAQTAKPVSGTSREYPEKSRCVCHEIVFVLPQRDELKGIKGVPKVAAGTWRAAVWRKLDGSLTLLRAERTTDKNANTNKTKGKKKQIATTTSSSTGAAVPAAPTPTTASSSTVVTASIISRSGVQSGRPGSGSNIRGNHLVSHGGGGVAVASTKDRYKKVPIAMPPMSSLVTSGSNHTTPESRN